MQTDLDGIAPMPCPIPQTESLLRYIDQSGVPPGDAKLAQFTAALALRDTPGLYAPDGKGPEAIAFVKLFDPCGAATLWLLEWDRSDEAFCWGYTTRPEDAEYSYVSLRELAFVQGRLGIGIEIDTSFLPTPIRALQKKLVRSPSAE